MEEMTIIFSSHDAEIAQLNIQLLKAQTEVLGVDEMTALKAQNESLNAKVTELMEHLLQNHVETNKHMTLLFQCIAPKPPKPPKLLNLSFLMNFLLLLMEVVRFSL